MSGSASPFLSFLSPVRVRDDADIKARPHDSRHPCPAAAQSNLRPLADSGAASSPLPLLLSIAWSTLLKCLRIRWAFSSWEGGIEVWGGRGGPREPRVALVAVLAKTPSGRSNLALLKVRFEQEIADIDRDVLVLGYRWDVIASQVSIQ
jgi:hypothetical protein